MNLRQQIIATESGSLVGLLTIIWIRSQIISHAGLNLDQERNSSSLVATIRKKRALQQIVLQLRYLLLRH